jgi:hypothetical protein
MKTEQTTISEVRLVYRTKIKAMNIRCKHCHELFNPCEDTIDLIIEGYIESSSANICDDCRDVDPGL